MITPPGSLEPDDFELAADFSEATGQTGLWVDGWSRLRRNRLAVVSLAFVLLVVLIAIIAHFWTPYPVWQQELGPTYQGPSRAHWLGLDASGRDILSRLMGGTEIALEVGVGATLMVSAVGIVMGLLAGFYRGKLDAFVSVLINLWYGVPDLLVALLIVVVTNQHGLLTIIFAITVTRWMDMARLVRGQTLSMREKEFVEGARMSGSSDFAIMFRHILPNELGVIVVQATLLIPQAILFEAFLSYLGLGVAPPTPSWGAMASDGYHALQFAPHIELAPAVALLSTLMAFNLLGDGLRDALDPRMRR
jgi:ABC-type dipeptide/oligopeptide/nickel transport system permease subunit